LTTPYHEYLHAAYKSLDHPDFSFVKKAFSARPYDPLVKRLRDYAAIEETAEADDDVCFGYFLKGRDCLWKLDLSLVGPFGIYVRLKSKISPNDFLVPGKGDLMGPELKIVDILKGAGIKLLGADDLSQPLPLALFNTARGDVKVYQALFSDRNKLPWES